MDGIGLSENIYQIERVKRSMMGSDLQFKDKDGKVIFTTKATMSMRNIIDVKGNIVGTVKQKFSLSPSFDICEGDKNGKPIGKISRSLLQSVIKQSPLSNPNQDILQIEDQNGKLIGKAFGDFLASKFEVFDDENNLVANITRGEQQEDKGLEGKLGKLMQGVYIMRIMKQDVFPTLLLLGLLIAIEITPLSPNKGGMRWGSATGGLPGTGIEM